MRTNRLNQWKFPAVSGSIIMFAILFSLWLMFHTFGYDSTRHFITMDAKLWSDFGSHIPLIRSFSMGGNLNRLLAGQASEYPGFPGEPIRYHFGFYALVGILEKIGVRIDIALNVLSGIGLALMIVMVYFLATFIFRSTWVGLLSIVFFLFNGTFGFLQYFAKHPLSSSTIVEIITNHRFTGFGPWDGGPVTAFWTLNIYTNQRHLALSFATALLMLALLVSVPEKNRGKTLFLQSISIAILMSFLLFINQATALALLPFLFWMFIIRPETRLILFISALITFPWFSFLQKLVAPAGHIVYNSGYLTQAPVTVFSFARFWAMNLGLHVIGIPIGILLAPKRIKLLFTLPLLILFIAPNVLQFSPDMINNHKFFNFFMIIGNMFTAFTLVSLFKLIQKQIIAIKIVTFILLASCFILLTLSGIIDFFAVVNPEPGGLPDVAANPIASWIAENSPPDAVFLNSTSFYHPANLAGRPIYYGYAYFTWSYGYNTSQREEIQRKIFYAPTRTYACTFLRQKNIRYVELSKPHDSNLEHINWDLWNQLIPAYYSKEKNMRIYDVETICPVL